MAASKGHKANFAVQFKYEAFCTGGRIQFSKDGNSLFCSCGNLVKVLNLDSGSVIQTVGKLEEEDDLNGFVAAPDDEIVVTSHRSGLLRQWNRKSAECTRTWKSIHKGPVACMAFDITSTLLATGGTDSTIKVWDIVKQYCTHNLKGAQGVFSVVQFHPDIQKLCLFGSANDSVLRVWDLSTSRCIAAMEGHYSTITSLSFTSDGNKLLSAGRDKVVILWDIVRYNSLKTIPVYETIESLILLPQRVSFPALNVDADTEDSELHFITAGDKGLLRVWRVSTGGMVYSQEHAVVDIPSKTESLPVVISQLEYVATRKVFAVMTYEHNILFYQEGDLTLQKQLIGYNDEILDIQLMGRDDSHLAVATNSIYIKVFELASLTCSLLKGHTDIVLALSIFTTNPCMMASSSKDNTVRLWLLDMISNQINCIALAAGHTQAVGAIATSRLSTDFVVSGGQDTTLKVWDIPRNVEHASGSTTSSYSLRSQYTEIAHEKDINSIAVSPNDQLIATGSQDKIAKLWRTKDGKLLGLFRGHRRGIWCVEFSPVDQVLASSSADTTIKIWNLSDFSCLKTFEGHDSSVLKVAFIAKGMQLLSSGSDGLVKLWTIKSNECVKTLDEHSDKVWGMVVNSTESMFVTGAADSTIIVWKDVTEQDRQDERSKQEDLIIQEQKLLNLLQAKKYAKALGIAITLDQPFRALTILREISKEPDGKLTLEDTMGKLRDDQIASLLQFTCIWNTNSRNCFEAQSVLQNVLKRYMPEELLKFPNMKTTVESLIPYTERHVSRLEKLMQQTAFLDFTWHCMKLEDKVS